MFFYTTEREGKAATKALTRVWLLPKEEYSAPQGTQPPRALASDEQATSPHQAISSEMSSQTEGELTAEVPPGTSLDALYLSASQVNMQALRQAIFEPDPIIQSVAFDLLAKWDRPEAVAVLMDAARSDQPEMRLQALHLLHHTDQADNGTILSALNHALADEDVNVKGFALQALAERRGLEAVEDLREALRDSDPIMRTMVIEDVVPVVQRELGLSFLQQVLSDDDETVCDLAAGLRQAIAEGQ